MNLQWDKLNLPSQLSVICSIGLTLPVLNSMWWPVNDLNSKPGPFAKWSMSMLTTSKVSQLKKISADSLPVLYLDFSSSAIDFDSQIVGDGCWSSVTDTTWIENKSLNHMMSPDSSSRNFMPFKPRFSERLESSDSIIWKCSRLLSKRSRSKSSFSSPPSIRRRNGQLCCCNSSFSVKTQRCC